MIARRHNVEIHVYADDHVLYTFFKIKNQVSQLHTLSVLTSCVSDIRSWMILNKLRLNDDKTEFLTICAPQNRKHISTDSVTVGGSEVAAAQRARNLGVVMEQTLSMDHHIQNLCRAALAQLRNIADVRHCLTGGAAETLVHAFVTSRLDYCNALFYGISTTSMRKLQYVQNSAARILTGAGKRQHITPVLRDLHWLPVDYRIRFKLLLLTHKALYGTSPQYLRNLLSVCTSSRSLRSSEQGLLSVPRTNLTRYGDRAFSVAAPTLWNALPRNLRSTKSLAAFKRDLKTYFFTLAFTH